MLIRFVGYEDGDSFDLYDVTSVVVLNDDQQVLKEFPIFTHDELLSWKNKVIGWYPQSMGSNFVTLSKDVQDSNISVVCLECGHTKRTYFSKCPLCHTKNEPLFVGI